MILFIEKSKWNPGTHFKKKKDRGTLILLYKIAIHSEVLRSVNVLKIVTRFWTEKSKYRLNE